MYISQEFDLKNPIERYDFIINKQDDQIIEVGNKILIALYVINEILIKAFNKKIYLFYVNDDASCKILIEKALNEKIDENTFFQSLMYIDLCKLIYRFTCARKFYIKDSTKKQLRLNSWGNAYIQEKQLIEKNKEMYNVLYMYFKKYYNENKEIYDELLNRLLSKINYLNAEKIKYLNDKIKIKILS